MRRSTRVTAKRTRAALDDSDDFVQSNSNFQIVTPKKIKKESLKAEDSSSESDIETYLKPADKIDLGALISEFPKHASQVSKTNSTCKSPSGSVGDTEVQNENEMLTIGVPVDTKIDGFGQQDAYLKQLEDTRQQVLAYQKRHQQQSSTKHIIDNVSSLLEVGETMANQIEQLASNASFHSSDFESLSEGSDRESWLEVKEKSLISSSQKPLKDIQITVQMPEVIKKKKAGDDLLAAMKRRLNRIRKENQILVHKVHLLCWLAHGNYVNRILNAPYLMASAVKLIPSEKSFPADRIDLNYLEMLVKWYRKYVSIVENKEYSASEPLAKLLHIQFQKKEAYNITMFTYMFIILIRAMGNNCRLVLNLQVEPLRPPASELCSLSTKPKINNRKSTSEGKDQSTKLVCKKINKEKSRQTVERKSIPAKEAKHLGITSEKTINPIADTDKSTSKSKRNSSKKGALENPEMSKTKTNKVVKTNSLKATGGSLANQQLKDETNKSALDENVSKPQPFKRPQRKSNRKNEKEIQQVKLKSQREPPPKRLKSIADLPEHSKQSAEIDAKSSVQETLACGSSGKGLQRRSTKTAVRSKPAPSTEGKESSAITTKELPTLSNNRNVSKGKSNIASNMAETKSTEFDIQIRIQPNSKPNLKGLKAKSVKSSVGKRNKDMTESVPQLDGTMADDEWEENDRVNILQVDGSLDGNDKPNLRKLRQTRSSTRNPPTNISTLKSERDDDLKKDTASGTKRYKRGNSSNTRPSSDDDFESTESSVSDFSACEDSDYEPVKEQKGKNKRSAVRHTRMSTSESDSDTATSGCSTDHEALEDFEQKVKSPKRSLLLNTRPKKKVTRKWTLPSMPQLSNSNIISKKATNSRQIFSSDDDNNKDSKERESKVHGKRKGLEVWLEVFLEAEDKWISVDIARGRIHCVTELYNRATHPVAYIVAWDNENYIKDITKRYCNNFNTATRKLRVDAAWWTKSLAPFLAPANARDRNEDEELNRQELDKPLPTSISEYKNHPLYALERHLLKFEGIYPSDAPPLGFIRKEPVYPRECVYTLRSRDIWLKHAKVVRLGEQPYKIVKARPKYDRLSNSMVSGQMLELFGPWQTQDYEPPTAEGGVVPRNAFGNVELFKKCMLPKGTVHLQLPGLNKIARRMNIDCASAIVGFDFHGGWSHPTYDGFVVCEEYEDQLIAAWELEQDEIARKEVEKREKRAYDNWKKLIRCLLIRERLKAKYDFGDKKPAGGAKKKVKKLPTVVAKKS